MDLKERIKNDLIASLKSGDNLSRDVLRLLNSDIKNEEIRKKREKLSEEDILKVIKSNIKKRKDAIELYKKGKREDLVRQEKGELEILQKYMPKQMSEEEIRKLVKKAVAESKASGVSNFGGIMKEVMQKAKGSADGKIISEILKEELEKIGK